MTHLLPRKMKGNYDYFSQEGMTVLKPNHDEVNKLRKAGLMPSEFGSRIWHASYLLINYLSKLDLSSELNIVELGCGWGLPAAYIRKRFAATVSATDADHQVKHYQQLISRVNCAVVPFFQRSFCQLAADDLSDINLFVGADICYSPTNATKIAKLFHHYMKQSNAEIVLADSGRKPFFRLVDEMSQTYALSLKEVRIDLPTPASGHILHLGKH